MQMTELEIVASYNQAKHQRIQIGILAELNQCDRNRIRDILKRHGAKPRQPPPPTGLKRVFSERLQQLKGDAPAASIAFPLGISTEAARVYCSGKSLPSIEVIVRIARYYEVSIDWLLGLEPVSHRTKEDQ